MKNLTNFRKTVETGVDPRLDTVLQARDNRERNCSGADSGDTQLEPVWGRERESD